VCILIKAHVAYSFVLFAKLIIETKKQAKTSLKIRNL